MKWLIATYFTLLVGGFGLFAYYDLTTPQPSFGATCLTDSKTNIYEKYTSCGLTEQEKIDLVAAEVAKIGPIPRFTYQGYDIQVTDIVPFNKGIEVYIRAWTPQGHIGFGPDGSVDIEKVRIIDPSILVPDVNGTVTHDHTNKFTGQIETFKYKVDPREAMLGDLILAIRQKSPSDHIIPNSIGQTTTIQPASQDNYIDSDNATINNSTLADLSIGDASTGSSETTTSLVTFDIAGAGIPSGSTINSATLSLYEYTAGAGGGGSQTTLTLKRILRNWNNTQSTYNLYSTGNSWTTAGAASDGNDRAAASSATLTIDATAAVAFIDITGAQLATDVKNINDGVNSNFGWGVYSDGSGIGVGQFAYNFFRSSDFGTAGDRPKLVIDSTPPVSGYDDDDEALGSFWP